MGDFSGDFTGSAFAGADLSGSRFSSVRLHGARLRQVDLSGAVLRSVRLAGMTVDTDLEELSGFTVLGVEVGPLVDAELDRRDPVRVAIRATDGPGMRAAWAALQQRWEDTYRRAAGMPPGALDQQVDDEWSFTSTLRHLVFATEVWLGAARGAPAYHPWGVPFTDLAEFADPDAFGLDPEAAPTYPEVLDLRRARVAEVADFLHGVTEESLAAEVTGPPWTVRPVSVGHCLSVILTEEYEHHRFATRDLDAIAAAG